MNDELIDKVIETINLLMKKAGDSAYDLAEKSGVTQPNIHRILKDKQEPKITTLSKIAKAYGVTCDQITGDAPLEFDDQNNVVKLFKASSEQKKKLFYAFENANNQQVEDMLQLSDVVSKYNKKEENSNNGTE